MLLTKDHETLPLFVLIIPADMFLFPIMTMILLLLLHWHI